MPRLIDADALAVDVLRLTIVDPSVAAYADAVLCLMQRAPTIEAEPVRHGRWETKPNLQWPAHNEQHCSACGWHIHKSKLRNSDKWDFCPNCGAKMDGGVSNA